MLDPDSIDIIELEDGRIDLRDVDKMSSKEQVFTV